MAGLQSKTPKRRASPNHWLARAESGEPDALFNLGLMYSTGDGAPLDYVTAHKWFNLAAMAGSQEARAVRAELARDMSPAEIAEAQRQAREWQRQHVH
jgi:TPR repeat protein